MTHLAPPPLRAADGLVPPPSPTASRPVRPRWRDTRLLVGLLLVLVSVVVGARVLAAADATASWLGVGGDLPAGHVLSEADLVKRPVRLDAATSSRYFRADSRAALLGRTLIRPVGGGNLLPRDALAYGTAPATRVVPVLVRPGRLPVVQPGDHVDLYVLAKGTRPGGDSEVRVLSDVEFLSAETLGSGDTAAQLRVPVGAAGQAVAASESERADLVRVDRGDTDQPGEPGPPETPAFGD